MSSSEDDEIVLTRPAAIMRPKQFALSLRRKAQLELGDLAHFLTSDLQHLIYKAYVSLTNTLLYDFFYDRIYRPIRDFQYMAIATASHRAQLKIRLKNLPRLPGA